MKRRLAYLFAGIFLVSLTFSPVLSAVLQNDQAKKAEAKKIIEKLIKAQGGRDVLSKIKDTTTSASMELIQMGMSGSMTMYQKEPNMMRMDMEIVGMVITQAYDGETAWMTNPQTGATEEMPEQFTDDIKRQAMGNDTLLNPDKHGITFSYEGKETIDEKEYIIIKLSFTDGYEVTMYLDSETYLVYKTKAMAMNQMGVEVEAETFMYDYKEVEGTIVPFTITIYQDGEEFMTMEITEIKYNSGLEDSFFKIEG
jgi:outer membrane lipoprotein-sorting protein